MANNFEGSCRMIENIKFKPTEDVYLFIYLASRLEMIHL